MYIYGKPLKVSWITLRLTESVYIWGNHGLSVPVNMPVESIEIQIQLNVDHIYPSVLTSSLHDLNIALKACKICNRFCSSLLTQIEVWYSQIKAKLKTYSNEWLEPCLQAGVCACNLAAIWVLFSALCVSQAGENI